jgi:small-conductance mechanosensitive channel
MQATLRWLAQNPSAWIEPLAVFALTVLAGLLARQIVLRTLRVWSRRSQSRAGGIAEESLRLPTIIWSVILAANFAIQSSHLPPAAILLAPKALEALWIISFTLMCARLARDLVRNYGSQAQNALPVTSLTQNLAQIAVLFLGIPPLLRVLGVEITAWLTAFGVGGLAVALALQDTLSNLFSGFHVAVAGHIRLGDYIKLNTGEEGYVADIGWRATTLRAQANNLIIVPNSKLAQAIVTNFCLPEKRLSASFKVSVSLDSDPEQVECLLSEAARQGVGEIPGMAPEPAPSAAFDPGFGESGFEFTVNFQVEDFGSQGAVRNELRKRALRKLRENGIAIALPARTIRVADSQSKSQE